MTQDVACTFPDTMLLTCSMVSAEACTAEEGCCITACAAACAAALAALATVWAAEDSLVAWLMAGMLPGMLHGSEAPPALPGCMAVLQCKLVQSTVLTGALLGVRLLQGQGCHCSAKSKQSTKQPMQKSLELGVVPAHLE